MKFNPNISVTDFQKKIIGLELKLVLKDKSSIKGKFIDIIKTEPVEFTISGSTGVNIYDAPLTVKFEEIKGEVHELNMFDIIDYYLIDESH